MIIRLYIAYKKPKMIEIGSENHRKIANIIARARIILLPIVQDMSFIAAPERDFYTPMFISIIIFKRTSRLEQMY